MTKLLFFILFALPNLVLGQQFIRVKNEYVGYEWDVEVVNSTKVQRIIKDIIKSQPAMAFEAEGCSGRSHFVRNWFKKEGIETSKIILSLLNFRNTDLKHKFRFTTKNKVRFSWHIANIIGVEDKGKVLLKVIDPTLFSRPVDVKEYVNYLTKDEIIPNKIKFNVTYCDPECFIERNRYQSRPYVKSMANINNLATNQQMKAMTRFFEDNSNNLENINNDKYQALYYYREMYKITGSSYYKDNYVRALNLKNKQF